MSKKYFIDSENVGDSWIDLLDTASEEDEILVFYTEKSPNMKYNNLIKLKQAPRDVTFMECCAGSNALDFQLSTELGYQVHDIGDTEFIIVSNDTGYDAVVTYWRERRIRIKRILGKTCSHIQQSQNEKNDEVVDVQDNSGILTQQDIEGLLIKMHESGKAD